MEQQLDNAPELTTRAECVFDAAILLSTNVEDRQVIMFAREWRAQDSPRRVIKVEVLGRGRAGEAGAFSWDAVAAASAAALSAENLELS